MSKQDRQKLSILVVLLVVLVFTVVLGYRMNRPAVTAAVQVPEAKTSANPPASTDARIRLDLVEKQEASAGEVGRKNVFEYRQTPPSIASSRGGSRGGISGTASPPPASGLTPPAGNLPPVTVAPPGPPPVPFKYQGYAVEIASGGQMTAFLVDDSSRPYNVTVGEVLMGRYRISHISPTAVEVEDLENNNRRQMLPIVK